MRNDHVLIDLFLSKKKKKIVRKSIFFNKKNKNFLYEGFNLHLKVLHKNGINFHNPEIESF